jgi:hypothetical protein
MAKPINLRRNRLINATSEEFENFMELNLVGVNKWESKQALLAVFIAEYPHYNNLTPHQMTKWMKEYSRQNGMKYEDRKTGARYEFYLKTKESEVSDEEE